MTCMSCGWSWEVQQAHVIRSDLTIALKPKR